MTSPTPDAGAPGAGTEQPFGYAVWAVLRRPTTAPAPDTASETPDRR